ncbi:hypothetical protein NL676_001060 [Syzygium grande]|nr:hypothetical protein NL676_001060 [Syzygium grande]
MINLDCGSSLNDVALCGSGWRRGEVKTLLEKLRNVAYFTLGNRIIQGFSTWKLKNELRPSFNWKSVTMTLNLAKRHLSGISYLLETCDFLETLTIYVYPSKPKDIQGNMWDRACNSDGSSYWHSVEGTFHCLAHHLKNVMIYACVTEPYVIELIEFLLGNALVLERMVISSRKISGETRKEIFYSKGIVLQKVPTSDMLLDFSKKVLSLPRISPHAVIHMTVG